MHDQESDPPVVFEVDYKQGRWNLSKELRIDSGDLEHEMERAAIRYMKWTALLAKASERVSKLKDKLEILEAELFVKYAKVVKRVSDVKYHVILDHKHQKMRRELRKWKDSERVLMYAEKALTHRNFMLQSLNANQRKEKELN